MNDSLHNFVEDGFCELGNVIDELECDNLLHRIKSTREFSSNLFLSELKSFTRIHTIEIKILK